MRQLIVHWCLACGLVFLYLLSLQAFSNGFAWGLEQNLAAIRQQYGLLGAVMFVISPVFIFDSIKLSNRFVGPMISFRSSLRKLASGDEAPPLTFRRGDFWRELTDDFNRIATELAELRAEQHPTEGAGPTEPADTS